MNRIGRLLLVICIALILTANANAHTTRALDEASKPERANVQVPEPVAALVRPVLDERERILSGKRGDAPKLGKLIYDLTNVRGSAADEALVVLMCFYVGESQEETDEVIARGRKMLVYLRKYEQKDPVISNRTYPASMRKQDSIKTEDFKGAIEAITHGRRGTWDNPKGSAL